MTDENKPSNDDHYSELITQLREDGAVISAQTLKLSATPAYTPLLQGGGIVVGICALLVVLIKFYNSTCFC